MCYVGGKTYARLLVGEASRKSGGTFDDDQRRQGRGYVYQHLGLILVEDRLHTARMVCKKRGWV